MTARLRVPAVAERPRSLPGRKPGKAKAEKIAATQAAIDHIVRIEGDIQEAMLKVKPMGEVGGRTAVTLHRYHMGLALQNLTQALESISSACNAAIEAMGEENLR